uniref:Uncharacterized protein n=1 Tax=Arundo donax TaxID=35708 RepID=A0A0A8YUE0_ARUDO
MSTTLKDQKSVLNQPVAIVNCSDLSRQDVTKNCRFTRYGELGLP